MIESVVPGRVASQSGAGSPEATPARKRAVQLPSTRRTSESSTSRATTNLDADDTAVEAGNAGVSAVPAASSHRPEIASSPECQRTSDSPPLATPETTCSGPAPVPLAKRAAAGRLKGCSPGPPGCTPAPRRTTGSQSPAGTATV